MKKLLAGILAAVVVFSLSMTAFAAETITEQNSSKEIDVHAKAVYKNADNMYDADILDGKAAIKTKNDVIISISADDTVLDELILNVIEIRKEDKEAYSWISGIMRSFSDKFTAYDIFFTDKDGNRVDVSDSVKVSITSPKDYRNIQVYHVSFNEIVDKVESKQSGNNTIFIADSFSYYVLADKASDNGCASDSANSDNTDTPKTGDESNLTLCIIILLIACSGVVISVIYGKSTRFESDRASKS